MSEDLADLFQSQLDKQANQYETQQRAQAAQQQKSDQTVDEAAEKLKELARRQQQEIERQRRAQQQGNRATQGGQSQRQLADEMEQMARQFAYHGHRGFYADLEFHRRSSAELREVQPRIFEMFMQIDRASERSRSGLGIGLTLVKRLVEMHGGTVVAHSEGPGHGSEFVVRLPLAVAAAGTSRAA